MMENYDPMNSHQVFHSCSKGSHLICSIDRKVALDLVVDIRRIYGLSGGFVNMFKDGITHLFFERRLPNLNDLLKNDSRFNTHFDHEGRIFLSNG